MYEVCDYPLGDPSVVKCVSIKVHTQRELAGPAFRTERWSWTFTGTTKQVGRTLVTVRDQEVLQIGAVGKKNGEFRQVCDSTKDSTHGNSLLSMKLCCRTFFFVFFNMESEIRNC